MKLKIFLTLFIGMLSVGEMNAIPTSAMYQPPKDEWKCSKCGWHTTENRDKCYYCGAPRP